MRNLNAADTMKLDISTELADGDAPEEVKAPAALQADLEEALKKVDNTITVEEPAIQASFAMVITVEDPEPPADDAAANDLDALKSAVAEGTGVKEADLVVEKADCIGSFGDCSADCKKVFTVVSAAVGGGATCSHDDKSQEECKPGEGQCPSDGDGDGEGDGDTATEAMTGAPEAAEAMTEAPKEATDGD